MGHFLLKARKYIFTVYHLDKGMTIHWESHFIPYDNIPPKYRLLGLKHLLNASRLG